MQRDVVSSVNHNELAHILADRLAVFAAILKDIDDEVRDGGTIRVDSWRSLMVMLLDDSFDGEPWRRLSSYKEAYAILKSTFERKVRESQRAKAIAG